MFGVGTTLLFCCFAHSDGLKVLTAGPRRPAEATPSWAEALQVLPPVHKEVALRDELIRQVMKQTRVMKQTLRLSDDTKLTYRPEWKSMSVTELCHSRAIDQANRNARGTLPQCFY